MKILAIETSCDETAISIIDVDGDFTDLKLNILSNVVHSQVAEHAPYGGVFPALAKREHSKNLIPVLQKALREAEFLREQKIQTPQSTIDKLHSILEREPELREQFLETMPKIEIPDIDAIAVTNGPGLEPALWVGINFAKALSLVWHKPVIATNHMCGHLFSVLLDNPNSIALPAVALLVSGGHTEIVLMKDGNVFEKIGQTRDDAVGEAFDKVARLLELPYPGGPEISRLAEKFEKSDTKNSGLTFPRPMINSDDFDFSFSGLKTAVLYTVKKLKERHEDISDHKEEIAYEFQNAAVDVLVKKTITAAQKHSTKTIILGGGVSANTKLQKELAQTIEKEMPDAIFRTPHMEYSGDNATMIALAGYFTYKEKGYTKDVETLKADGNLSL